MGCGCESNKDNATYICTKCGKEEMREAKAGEVVKSCCGQPMKKKHKKEIKYMQNKCCFAEKFFHFAHSILENHEELGLTDVDVKKVRDLKIGTKKSLIRNRAEVELLMVDIISSLYQEKPDISAINKLIDKKFDVKKAGMKKLIAAFVGIKKLLSREQIKQIKAICKSEGHSQSKEGQCRR